VRAVTLTSSRWLRTVALGVIVIGLVHDEDIADLHEPCLHRLDPVA